MRLHTHDAAGTTDQCALLFLFLTRFIIYYFKYISEKCGTK